MAGKKEIKNLKKAGERILKAIKNQEGIVIFGDADLDGVASVIILKESILSLEGKILAVAFPDREKDGYGISEAALNNLKEFAPALFVALDLGIGNFKEVKIAKKMGFEVVIIDHHEILGKMPKAQIIVDPKQKGDKYPFKFFAAVGLAFKLSEILFKNKMPSALRKSFLELTAMATISDMMPRTDDNEEMVAEGLSYILDSWRPGIRALLEIEDFMSPSIIEQVIKINSLLNIRDCENKFPSAYRLLTAKEINKARDLAKILFDKIEEKKRMIRDIVEEVDERVANNKNSEKEKIIFEGSPDWQIILLGSAGSILSAKYKKPVFLYAERGDDGQASIRSPKGFDTVDAMKSCAKKFITFGGHQQASGFRAKKENLNDIKESLEKFFKK